MTDIKSNESPDFNDEFIHYGLEVFTDRLRARIAQAKETKLNQLQVPEFIGAPDDLPEPPEGMFEENSHAEPELNGFSFTSRFLMGQKNEPKGCSQNVVLILENDPRWQGVFAENLLTGAIDILKKPPIEQIKEGELLDPHVSMIHVWIEEHYQIVVQPLAMRNALVTISAKNQFHPVHDYLNDLPAWDGVKRCATWLKNALNPKNEPDEYLEAVGERFLIGAVRRIMDAPEATKVDNMLVFEGLQGDGKSTLIEALFSPWHGDTPLPLGDKDAYIGIRGCWGYEMAEMDSFNKSMTSTAKSFLSSHTDNYRPPFGTRNVKYPRQTVFIGSVNHSEYLTDNSGNRRYWPVWGDFVNVPWLKENRPQLWAEALHLYREGKPHWIDKKKEPELLEMVTYEQALREHPDAWEAILWCAMQKGEFKDYGYMSYQILTETFGLDVRSINKAHEMKLSAVMQKLGWTRERKRIEGYTNIKGKPVAKPYLYVTPESAKACASADDSKMAV